jgi:hypothetical protein
MKECTTLRVAEGGGASASAIAKDSIAMIATPA